MIRIAYYGTENKKINVTDRILQDAKLKKTIIVNNSYFGIDPCPDALKKLFITLENDKVHLYNENSLCCLEFLNEDVSKKDRIGIFYTNNNINKLIIDKSLESIKNASEFSKNVIIIVCPQIPYQQKYFLEVESLFKSYNHANIASQIVQALSIVKNYTNFKYVSFLEHDVLYPENYFAYENFNVDCIYNDNYIGLCKDGFQIKVQNDRPLHQITMNYSYAINYFEQLVLTYLRGEFKLLEPQDVCKYTNSLPSVHINHGKHFTSHFNTYSKKLIKSNDYWGDSIKYTSLFHS